MIIQENRSTDNLFGADKALVMNGAHIVHKGSCHRTQFGRCLSGEGHAHGERG